MEAGADSSASAPRRAARRGAAGASGRASGADRWRGSLQARRRWRAAAAAWCFAGAAWAVAPSICWRGGYTEERCCGGEDASCFDAVFTRERCCSGSAGGGGGGVRGDPSCWQDGYSFQECCVGEAKAGCWDSEFTPRRCCADVAAKPLDGPLSVLEEPMGDAMARLDTHAHDGPLACEETPDGFWRLVKVMSTFANVSGSYGAPAPSDERVAILAKSVRAWVESDSAWRASKAACPVGAMNAIVLAAPRLDWDVGEATARAAYVLHQQVLEELTTAGKWPPAFSEWPLLSGVQEHSPRLLGVTGRHSCHGTPLRVFMYSVEKLAHMTSPVLTCSNKMPMCTSSVHIHRWLLSGSCLTDDPDKADLFFVPAYESCYNETSCGIGKAADDRCFPRDFDPSADLRYFERRSGVDHIFGYGCNLLPFADPLMIQTRNAIYLTVESFQAGSLSAWSSRWKDVIIPGFMPKWRMRAMLSFNRPMMQRTILVGFHGHSRNSPGVVGQAYKNSPLSEVRDRVISYFWNQSGCSSGGPVQDYFRRMGNSRFCLVPAGLTAWTIHLFEAFFLGCIPVILSDDIIVPFQREIDWPSMSIQVPTNVSMRDLHARLASFSDGRLKQLYRELAKARCWVDYSLGWGAEGDDPQVCSPYRAIMSAFAERARLRDTLYPLQRFWSPPPTTDA